MRLFHQSLSRSFLALALLACPATLAFSQTGTAPKQAAPESAKQHAASLSEAFRSVYRSVAPSVVNIRSTQRMDLGGQNGPGGQTDPGNPSSEELFRRFFGQEAPEGLREFRFGQPQAPRERKGEGTGIVARADGYIVTNNHVVDGATSIKVRLDNETEYDGTIVGTDPDSDLAVVKIEASGLTAATFGNSDSIEIGDWVLALGSPLGLRHTMTAGIVSAKGRGTLGLAEIGDFIQTDCAINPGNSGGPLVNLDGEVIGINTAISTRTGFYMGVGFAIPSNIITPVINTIIEGGTVRRGWLGVEIGAISSDVAKYSGFEGNQGVLVADVMRNSPAEAAGMRPGDIVTQINGRPVSDSSQLLNVIAAAAPGTAANLTVHRDRELQEIVVTLGDRSEQRVAGTRRQMQGQTPGGMDLGLVVQDVDPELARRLGIEGRAGVVVTRITPDTIAAKAGLQAGDLISMVNETKVSSAREFVSAMRNVGRGQVVRLQIYREGETTFLFLKPNR